MAGKVADSAKAALRRDTIAARDALPASLRGQLSARITRRLLALDRYRNAGCVLAYMGFGSEFDIDALITDVTASGRRLCLPRVDRAARMLDIHAVDDADELEPGKWGIREPRADAARVVLGSIDFVLVPGVAFSPRCERLGYGGGYYDRLIARFVRCPPLVAAAFGLQLRASIPVIATDQRVDLVITENSAYGKI